MNQREELLNRFRVEAIGESEFAGVCHPSWPNMAFGGQLAAQILQSAAHTVDTESLDPWSLHTIFHAPVKPGLPITYRVVELKSGRTVSSRQVLVEQEGKLRTSAIAVFGAPADGPQHQLARPDVIAPEHVMPVERLLTPEILPADVDHVAAGYPDEALFELRIAEPPESSPTQLPVWMRALPELDDDPLIVATTLCYLSDVTLGTTAITPHGGRAANPDLQFGAVELALWFTAPARLHEWTLFAQNTSFAGGGHALAHGAFYNSDGDLCAIAVQNALMRQR